MSYDIGFHSPAAYLPRANIIPQKINSQNPRGNDVAVNDDASPDAAKRAELRVIPGKQGNQDQDRSAAVREAKKEARDQAAAAKAEARQQRVEQQRQEKAQKEREKAEANKYEFERRVLSTVPGPAEMVGTKDALSRLDSDTNGRIDQLEIRHSYRANSDATTYEALTQYRKSLDLLPSPDPTADKTPHVSEDA
jgi:hypothetical protein